jgi:predicted Ser/Thr protein kinase
MPRREGDVNAPKEQPEPWKPSGTDPAAETFVFRADASLGSLSTRYDLLTELGRGGMGVVYRARDRETSDTVALKFLRPDISSDPGAMDRFRSELLLARKITHKNVCRMHELLRFADAAVISMEYVEGETLRSVLRRPQGIAPIRALEWAHQVCAALEEAHSQGVVHRDLKPENIMLDAQGNVKVMDFGLARPADPEMTRTEVIAGTPGYMSPEQAEGKALDARSDIYSLGLVLYEMFTGQPAFRAESAVGLALKQVKETPPAPREVNPTVPRYVEHVILRCLEKDPKKRFASAAEVRANLLEAATERRPMARIDEVTLPPHLERWQLTDWALAGAAVAGLALFFHFFAQTSFGPQMQVTFDRSVLLRRGEEHAQRLGMPLEGKGDIDLLHYVDRYRYTTERVGGRAALQGANDSLPYLLWQVWWSHPVGVTYATFNHRGEVVHLYTSVPPTEPREEITPDQAQLIAQEALLRFYGRSAAELQGPQILAGMRRDQPSLGILWTAAGDVHGMRQRYRADVSGGKVWSLGTWYELPAGYQAPRRSRASRYAEAARAITTIPLLLFGLVLGVLQRRKVDLSARWRVTGAAVAFVVQAWAIWLLMLRLDHFRLPVGAMVGVAAAVAVLLGLVTLERATLRAWPEKLVSLVRMLGGRVQNEACGLAVVRGSCAGLLLLGVNAGLVAWVLSAGHAWLAPNTHLIWAVLWLRQPAASLHTIPLALFAALFLGSALALLAAPLRRWLHRPWRGILAAVAIVAFVLGGVADQPMFHMVPVQPEAVGILVVAVQLLLLGLLLLRFDILTVMVAVFTFEFWWQNYTLMTYFAKVGATEQWIAFSVWGLLVLGAAAVVWQRQLKTAYKRIAELGA